MIVAVSAPLRIKTENEFRALASVKHKSTGRVIGNLLQSDYTAKTRLATRVLLATLPKPPPKLADGTPNRYRVKLTRIAPGVLDSDSLPPTFKAVRDEVAAWLGIDDGHARIVFSYAQEGCPFHKRAIRIEVQDETPGGTTRRDLAEVPAFTREARPRGSEGPAPRARDVTPQIELSFRECWALLPWDQDGGAPVFTKLAITGMDPPKRVRVRSPAMMLSGAASVRYAPGSELTLHRTTHEIEGREAWLYRESERR